MHKGMPLISLSSPFINPLCFHSNAAAAAAIQQARAGLAEANGALDGMAQNIRAGKGMSPDAGQKMAAALAAAEKAIAPLQGFVFPFPV